MIEKIKDMSDKELVSFINRMTQNKLMLCIKCGNPTSWNNRKTINVGIYNRRVGQKVKKLKLDGLDNSITDLTDSYWLGYIDACEVVFDRINELKESDK